ncbi:ATP-dependent DNA helicase RecG [Candidatus Wirthbacteria bacterium CG2_30_54_11]|uniref:ATP-dependent DNA helicase RecG n=1 Tax=Candidatus Wirthbacteria bacterium CG2_30_54_11 TaxID=1817892 RepID=A0A1J5IMT9_9BACT|nr:MAG: ATP-dependent DNA helicase RecG [Candidatus Wirthbacteria bacterium CG2_30_54_11]
MAAPLILDDPVDRITGIGDRQKDKLAKLNIRSVRDFIFHFPRRYDDFSEIVPIRSLRSGAQQTVKGTLWHVEQSNSRGGLRMLKATVVDPTGVLHLVWFNQPYLKDQLKEGTDLLVSGKVEVFRGVLSFNNPSFEPVPKADTDDTSKPAGAGSLHVGRIIPIYAETEGVTSKWLRTKIRTALDHTLNLVEERQPAELLARQKLLGIREALEQVHFPGNQKQLARARERLGFDELFFWQLRALLRKSEWKSSRKAVPMTIQTEALKTFRAALPFDLTECQRRSIREILEDIRSPSPMSRLLEGDVGSGKTVVAAAGLLNAAAQGAQSALMAPTEILAEQHYRSLVSLLKKHKLSIALLTGSRALLSGRDGEDISRPDLLKIIKSGEVNIVVGTHALIQDDVVYQSLALVVIDEQHRFGVEQRKALMRKGAAPDVLVMTATPIPRSLALALFGDLELSILDEMPKGRKPILTEVVYASNRTRVHEFVKKQLDSGRQAFVICPLVEESEVLEVKAATEEHELLQQGAFKNYRLGLLHGRMKSKDKDAVIQAFRAGEYQMLVSTSVVEVGVDIPNASVMLIEGAERFGLAQLHQFRGRVGRGAEQSYCFLFATTTAPESEQRLRAMVRCQDGFQLSEEDLKLRGPGEVFGTRQSGIPDLRMASLLDAQLIKRVREEAELWVGHPSFEMYFGAAVASGTGDSLVWN